MKRLKGLLEWGGIKKDVAFLVISGAALLASMFRIFPIPFDAAWAAVVLCGIPIIMEAVTGLVTAFDIKADVLVSLALVASIIIGAVSYTHLDVYKRQPLYGAPLTAYGKCYETLESLINRLVIQLNEEELKK